MALKLTAAESDLLAEEMAIRTAGIMEGAGHRWEPGDVVAFCEEIDPLREAIEELSGERAISDLSLAGEVAMEALSAHKESAGHALAAIHHVKAGRVVEYRSRDCQTPESIIEDLRAEAERSAERAHLAQSVVWALHRADDQVKAAAGDPRAQESVRTQERWDEENQKLQEAV